MPDLLVTCDNLVKIYKTPDGDIEVVALQGLDLEVRAGEMMAIVGRSGSGKTTLLNILGALDLPSAGRCVVDGYDLTRLKERELDDYRRFVVGHVWQNSDRNLQPDLTIEANVSLPQLLAGVSADQRRARAKMLLAHVGLNGMERKYPQQLSGGEQQRAAIAVALANEPTLLLADEPTGELDSTTADECLALLRRLNHELGLTVVIVTHDIAAAAQADRTIAIRDGRTSTETIRRAQPLPLTRDETGAAEGSAVIGLARETHLETAIVDQAGRVQLPEEAVSRLPFAGRADLLIAADHVELWPVSDARSGAESGGTSAIIGLPATMYHERVIIDRVGNFQLSEEALDRVPFGRHATIQLRENHVELWPHGVSER